MLVDEHPLWLDAVETVLERVSVDVVGKAVSFDEASAMLAELSPDLLIAEIWGSERVSDGIEWLREIRRTYPSLKVVVVSISNDSAHVEATLAAGVAAYVVKKAHPDDLAVAVRQAYEHSIFLPRQLPANGTSPKVVDHPDLTRRELEILRLVAEGHSNAELARMLWVTEQTVKFHLSNIYRKLNVANRTEASRWAQLQGLLHAPSSAGLVEAAR